MQPGERQVAPTRDGIRRDHVARYEWAVQTLARHAGARARVLDLGCGVGYGTQLLAQNDFEVVGLDKDQEALNYASSHYAHSRASYSQADLSCLEELGVHNAAVCFELIEHLQDPVPLLKSLRASVTTLLVSVPNEDIYPHGGRIKFHYRHYTCQQFEALLRSTGWDLVEKWGQLGPESEVEQGVNGRTLIAVCRRAEAQSLKDATQIQAPEHVAIIGLGPSCASFFELTRRLGGVSEYCDEVWGINAMGDVLRCDRVFHMDDLRIQEARAAERPDSNIAAMVKWLRRHPGPVYTSVVREGYPGLVAFPLQDVLNGRYDTNGGAPYFNNTAAYAIAYAVHIGVKRLSLFGMDFTLANSHHAEQGRACCEFWLGIAAARGMEISVPDTSSLLDACEPDEHRLYGYDCVNITLRDRTDGGVEVHMQPREQVPTAAQIEARYDHTKHPSPLMRK